MDKTVEQEKPMDRTKDVPEWAKKHAIEDAKVEVELARQRRTRTKNDPKLMDPLTRAEIAEIERLKREENDARAKKLWGFGASSKPPRRLTCCQPECQQAPEAVMSKPTNRKEQQP